ncbi:hypothetical protein Tco_1532337 [Tanacetum coccineum]
MATTTNSSLSFWPELTEQVCPFPPLIESHRDLDGEHESFRKFLVSGSESDFVHTYLPQFSRCMHGGPIITCLVASFLTYRSWNHMHSASPRTPDFFVLLPILARRSSSPRVIRWRALIFLPCYIVLANVNGGQKHIPLSGPVAYNVSSGKVGVSDGSDLSSIILLNKPPPPSCPLGFVLVLLRYIFKLCCRKRMALSADLVQESIFKEASYTEALHLFNVLGD